MNEINLERKTANQNGSAADIEEVDLINHFPKIL